MNLRLKRVTQSRMAQVGIVMLGIGLGIFLRDQLRAQAPAGRVLDAGTLHAHHVERIDAKGQVRARLDASAGSYSLSLLGHDGKKRADLGVGDTNDIVTDLDTEHEPEYDNSDLPYLHLLDHEGNVRLKMAVGSFGSARLEIQQKNGNGASLDGGEFHIWHKDRDGTGLKLEFFKEIPSLNLSAGLYNPASIFLNHKGAPFVAFNDPQSVIRAALTTTDDGIPLLNYFTPDNKAILQLSEQRATVWDGTTGKGHGLNAEGGFTSERQ